MPSIKCLTSNNFPQLKSRFFIHLFDLYFATHFDLVLSGKTMRHHMKSSTPWSFWTVSKTSLLYAYLYLHIFYRGPILHVFQILLVPVDLLGIMLSYNTNVFLYSLTRMESNIKCTVPQEWHVSVTQT